MDNRDRNKETEKKKGKGGWKASLPAEHLYKSAVKKLRPGAVNDKQHKLGRCAEHGADRNIPHD